MNLENSINLINTENCLFAIDHNQKRTAAGASPGFGKSLVHQLFHLCKIFSFNKIGGIISLSIMNYGAGYNQPYVYEQEVATVGSPRPYYNQPLMVQPQPQVIIVEDRYRYNNNNNLASTEAALCAWCCCMELLCCCLL